MTYKNNSLNGYLNWYKEADKQISRLRNYHKDIHADRHTYTHIDCNILINQWREGMGFPRDFLRESRRDGMAG